jgi:glycosyltransferase involved in cell wall biosynthesis
MKLLIITQKIDKNDPILGFFVCWVEEFAKHFEFVTVICLGKGEYNLPSNTKVLSLGKEKYFREEVRPRGGAKRRKRSFLEEKIFLKLKYTFNFYKYIIAERKNYDAVFVHMNPEYVVLGGLLWKALRKKISLWYTHRNVDLKLKIAEKFVNNIFTASKESFQLDSKKVHIVGHGIDVDKFKNGKQKTENEKIEILHIGRITKIKNINILIEAGKILKEKLNRDFNITLVGSPITDDDLDYIDSIKSLISKYGLTDIVNFAGSVSNDDMVNYYHGADITVNLTPTGGVDKAVIESMAGGVPVFSSNKTFVDYFGEYSDELIFKEKDPIDLARKIINFFKRNDTDDIRNFLTKQAEKKASIRTLIKKIVEYLK